LRDLLVNSDVIFDVRLGARVARGLRRYARVILVPSRLVHRADC
jgi:hypothetical protein